MHCDSVTTSVGLMGPTKLTPFAQTSQRWICISNDTTSNSFFHTYLINTIGHFPQMTATGPSLQSKSDQKLYRRQSIHSNDIIVMLKNLFNLLQIKKQVKPVFTKYQLQLQYSWAFSRIEDHIKYTKHLKIF